MNYPQRLAQDFSTAAQRYDDFAGLQRQVVDSLLPWVPANSHQVLDAGAGTGYALQRGWLALDIAEGMCRQVAYPPAICADMQVMPFANASFEGVFTSLAMQWLESSEQFLREAYRCTKSEGWLVASTLGKQTLQELRQSFTQAGQLAPLLPFQSLEEILPAVEASSWKLSQHETEMLTTTHVDVREVLQHLKGLGARYKAPQSGGLRGKSWLKALENNYPSNLNDNIKISWEVIKIKLEK